MAPLRRSTRIQSTITTTTSTRNTTNGTKNDTIIIGHDDGNNPSTRKTIAMATANSASSSIAGTKTVTTATTVRSEPASILEAEDRKLLLAKNLLVPQQQQQQRAVSMLPTTTTLLPHPYMLECYPKRSRTLKQIRKMEEAVLAKVIDRSKWRSFPSGPSQCYERRERSSSSTGMRTTTNSTTTTTTIGSGSTIVPTTEEGDRRIIKLKIIDNTFYERLQLILAFRVAQHAATAATAANPHPAAATPRISAGDPRPYWRMTKDIAILDQLESIELFRCTGILPKSMNHLIKLTRLQLDGCRNIDLSELGLSTNAVMRSAAAKMKFPLKDDRSLRNLMELKITDCEGLTPTKFRNLPHLQYLTLMRWDKSNINTTDLGKRWIAELSSSAANCSTVYCAPEHTADPRVNKLSSVSAGAREARRTVGAVGLPFLPLSLSCTSLSFRCTLKQLTFCGTRLTNHDLGRMLFHMVPKLPNLETLIINDNPEIDSFKKVIDAMEVLASVAAPPHSFKSKQTAMTTTTMTTTVAATATTASILDTTTTVTAGTAPNSYVVDIGGVPVTIAHGIPTASGPLCVAGVNVTTINGVPIRIINEEDTKIQQPKRSSCTTTTPTTDAATRKQISIQSKLRTLKLSDSKIDPKNLKELDSVIYFLEHLYPTIGVLKVFSYDVVPNENPDDDSATQHGPRGGRRRRDTGGHVRARRGGGNSLMEWYRLYNQQVGYEHFNILGEDTTSTATITTKPPPSFYYGRRRIELPKKQANKLHKIEYLLSMNSTNAFTMTGARPSSSLASSSLGLSSALPTLPITSAATTTTSSNLISDTTVPLSVWPLAVATASRKKYRTCNQESDLRDETNFRQDTRYDVVYHLLRHGPIFAAGQTCRYKRKREYYPRGAKKSKN